MLWKNLVPYSTSRFFSTYFFFFFEYFSCLHRKRHLPNPFSPGSGSREPRQCYWNPWFWKQKFKNTLLEWKDWVLTNMSEVGHLIIYDHSHLKNPIHSNSKMKSFKKMKSFFKKVILDLLPWNSLLSLQHIVLIFFNDRISILSFHGKVYFQTCPSYEYNSLYLLRSYYLSKDVLIWGHLNSFGHVIHIAVMK